MQRFSEQDLEQMAMPYLTEEITEVFATTDGQVFYDINRASQHATERSLTVYAFGEAASSNELSGNEQTASSNELSGNEQTATSNEQTASGNGLSGNEQTATSNELSGNEAINTEQESPQPAARQPEAIVKPLKSKKQ